MAVAFRSDNDVTNGTAGTSVTVTKPSGIVDTGDNGDRDHLIAFISCTGTTTITPPADWTLVDSAVDAGNNVTLWCYRKLASSEGANWTWTLGASRRNWGWVGAYTGVDPDSPVSANVEDLTLTSNTTLAMNVTIAAHALGVGGSSAVRAASGSATTWSHTYTVNERADLSTNGGAGTDIAGVVSDGDDAQFDDNQFLDEAVASQSQTAGVQIAIALNPYFVPYGAGVGDEGLVVEAAFGADPEGDQSGWADLWQDITARVAYLNKVVLRHGLGPSAITASPAELRLTLLNLDGAFTHPTGTYADQFVRNLPIRVRLNGFGTSVGGDGYHRGTFYLSAASQQWDPSTNYSVVNVVANGILRRIQQRKAPAKSPAYAAIMGYAPLVYLPFEDGSDATSAASPIPGVAPAALLNVDLGATAEGTGASSMGQLSATSDVEVLVPAYTHNGGWTAGLMMIIPSEPAAALLVLEVLTTGTAPRWQISVVPGSPSTLRLQAFDSSVSTILTASVNITDESAFYGSPWLFTVSTVQNGTDIEYVVEASYATGSFAASGTLSSRTNGAMTKMRMASSSYTTDRFGHLFGFADVPDLGYGLLLNGPVVGGNVQDWDWERFARLCTEAGIPYTYQSYSDRNVEMGVQPTAPFMDHIREIETVGAVVVTDSGQVVTSQTTTAGLLWLPALDDRYNVDPSLTLDVNSGQVTQLGPSLDDNDTVNDVTVARDDGSFARAVDGDSVTAVGRYEENAVANVYDDAELEQLAGHRLSVGTVDGWRYPTVRWDLRASPELAQEWVSTRLWQRVDILNPPSQYPPEDIRALLVGYVETIAQDQWTVEANLSPYDPYEIFEIADTTADQNEWAGRLAGDEQCALRTAVDDNDLSIVFDPNFYRWTTTADDFDPDLKVRLYGNNPALGEVVEVSSIATTAATFVGAGTVSHGNNADVTPTIHASSAAGDGMVMLAAIRNSGTGVPNTPTGWTRLRVFEATDNVQLFFKVHSGSESSPTVSFTGGVANADTSAQIATFRGTPTTLEDPADVVIDAWSQLNASAANIAYPGIYPRLQEGCIIIAVGWKQDDWTSVATLTGFTAEIGEPDTTTGDDQGIVWDYVIQTTPAVVNEGSFVVTGGANAISRGAVVALAGGYQTMTVSARGANGFSKAWPVGTRIEVEDAYKLGL